MTDKGLAQLETEHKVLNYLESLLIHDRPRLLRMITFIKNRIIEEEAKHAADWVINRAKEK